ncbi:ATP phosphoribosyltransferase [Candidatus Sumerlaeota bacterium]|nr:ATP phosphoribosyltransferase [Candidatus Sumerlaeota bacterium]
MTPAGLTSTNGSKTLSRPVIPQNEGKTDLTPGSDNSVIHLALPKGRMQEGVFKVLADAGIQIRIGSRGYRPTLSLPGFETKILKPQNIVEMLHLGSRDIGFAGADWVRELNANLVELLDTELDPVRIVVAAPKSLLEGGKLPKGRKFLVASEYETLTKLWIKRSGIDATFVRSYGATEVFPPEDADIIVDNTATGATLEANDLMIIDEVMKSSTRLYANPSVVKDAAKMDEINRVLMLMRSVLEARKRVMLEVNVTADKLEALVAQLPSMREPTISSLHGDSGYAVKAAVPRKELPILIPKLKAAGGTDVIVTGLSQIVP